LRYGVVRWERQRTPPLEGRWDFRNAFIFMQTNTGKQKMSDTPRTDALEKVDRDEWDKYYKEHTDDSFDEFLVYDIARGFERELAAANAEIARLQKELVAEKEKSK